MLRCLLMRLTDIYEGLGQERFGELLRGVSMGKLKIYQLYDRFKTRCHLAKMNPENLRKAAPRLWARIVEGDQEFAAEAAQAILVSHLDMISAILDFLEIPHENGFFAKDMEAAKFLGAGWQQRVYDRFQERFSPVLVLFYINHLDWEVAKAEQIFSPAAVER